MNELLTPEERALEVKRLVNQLQAEGRTDLLLHAIGVPLLEELRIEAAKGRLSRLVITKDYRFILEDYQKEVELQPVHKAVYLLFLAHPEGIEFKRLFVLWMYILLVIILLVAIPRNSFLVQIAYGIKD